MEIHKVNLSKTDTCLTYVLKRIGLDTNLCTYENFNEFFHNHSRMNYLKSIKRDCKKEEWLEKNNFKLLEIYEKDLKLLSAKFFLDNFNISIF